ncbi:MAG: hypothetical protein SVV03_02690 [Candidatus Nanohaloarchaea archaeon]|nr:hypothetical protein [Candidatus Nanohaloarchaea archaeon]
MPEDHIDKREKLEKIAENIYEVDYLGIALNGALAALGSGTGSISAHVITGIPVSDTFLLFFTTFTPLFTIKVLGEYAKQRAVKEGQVDAYIKGVKDSDNVSFNIRSGTGGPWLHLYFICNSASYTRSSLFDGKVKPTFF